MAIAKDITGIRFGRLTAIRRLPGYKKPARNSHWECLCECGKTAIVDIQNLKHGRSRSCGCSRPPPKNKTHGRSQSSEYRIWHQILRRCCDPKSADYYSYGRRGVKVCDRWRNFSNFLSDMGPRPSADHSIDRINNDGDYEPGNCRWATPVVQSNNRRSNHIVAAMGRKLSIAEWARVTGISQFLIAQRINKLGWPGDIAVTEPARPCRRRD